MSIFMFYLPRAEVGDPSRSRKARTGENHRMLGRLEPLGEVPNLLFQLFLRVKLLLVLSEVSMRRR